MLVEVVLNNPSLWTDYAVHTLEEQLVLDQVMETVALRGELLSLHLSPFTRLKMNSSVCGSTEG